MNKQKLVIIAILLVLGAAVVCFFLTPVLEEMAKSDKQQEFHAVTNLKNKNNAQKTAQNSAKNTKLLPTKNTLDTQHSDKKVHTNTEQKTRKIVPHEVIDYLVTLKVRFPEFTSQGIDQYIKKHGVSDQPTSITSKKTNKFTVKHEKYLDFVKYLQSLGHFDFERRRYQSTAPSDTPMKFELTLEKE